MSQTKENKKKAKLRPPKKQKTPEQIINYSEGRNVDKKAIASIDDKLYSLSNSKNNPIGNGLDSMFSQQAALEKNQAQMRIQEQERINRDLMQTQRNQQAEIERLNSLQNNPPMFGSPFKPW